MTGRKFDIINPDTGEKIKPEKDQMFVMNSSGIFLVVTSSGYDSWTSPLSEYYPKYDVVWK